MKFAAVVLQARSSEPRLLPRFECIPGHLPSARFPPYGRFACVWLLTCVRSLRNVGFCSFLPAICGFSWRYFLRLLLLLFWKIFKDCFIPPSGAVKVTKSICATRPIFTAQCKELFFHSGDWWGEKKLPPNYLQKHKHMPEEFESNNLPPWFKLWASCVKTGRPHTTFPWSLCGVDPGRDPLWSKTCLDPTATEEFHVFTSSEVCEALCYFTILTVLWFACHTSIITNRTWNTFRYCN